MGKRWVIGSIGWNLNEAYIQYKYDYFNWKKILNIQKFKKSKQSSHNIESIFEIRFCQNDFDPIRRSKGNSNSKIKHEPNRNQYERAVTTFYRQKIRNCTINL